MAAKPRLRGTLRTPWRRFSTRRNPTPVIVHDPKAPAKAGLREGGLEHSEKDPLRHAPLKEPYGAESGIQPTKADTPATVTGAKKKGGNQDPL